MRDTISSVSSYDRVNSAFENAVMRMQENLQYLADNDKVSDKFLSMQNLILKNLIDYQQRTERYISTLEMENVRLSNGRIKEIEKLKDIKESFEALCIIHGIMDFPIWMNRGKNYLICEAISHQKENMITLPYSLKEWIDKLPEGEQKIFYK
jgi:hypothetical protein